METPTEPTDLLPVMTVEEAATLGRCKPETIRSAIARGDLEAVKPARRWLVKRTSLLKWLGLNPARPRSKARNVGR